MTGRVQAWQCIGCGKIEAPQTCIGVCQDRKVEFVYAFEHEETLEQLKLAHRQAAALEALAYRALQSQARRTLASLARDALDPGATAPMARSSDPSGDSHGPRPGARDS